MGTVQILKVPWFDPAEVKSVEVSLSALQSEIDGGYLESVTLSDGAGHIYCNEEGKRKNLPPNRNATILAVRLGWRPISQFHPGIGMVPDILVGDVLFLGFDEDGNEADVPAMVLDAARELGILTSPSAG